MNGILVTLTAIIIIIAAAGITSFVRWLVYLFRTPVDIPKENWWED